MSGDPVVDELKESFEALNREMQGYGKALAGADAKTLNQGVQGAQKINQQRINAEQGLEAAERNAGGFQDNMGSQQQIKQIVDTVSALGQLAFAIQSVQNLGSI